PKHGRSPCPPRHSFNFGFAGPRTERSKLLRKIVTPPTVHGQTMQVRWKRKLRHTGSAVLEELFPYFRLVSFVNTLCTFGVKHLTEVERCGRAVQVGEEGVVVVFGGGFGELDDGRRLLEHFAAAVEDEVVVGGYEGEADG